MGGQQGHWWITANELALLSVTGRLPWAVAGRGAGALDGP